MSGAPSDNGLGNERSLRLGLPAVHRTVRVARNLVRRFARMDGVPAAEVDTLALVTSELLENAVDHGGGGAARSEAERSEDTRMSLELELSGAGWELRVSDQGGADPDDVAQRIQPGVLPDLEDERGRGLFLLTTLVDSIEVQRSADGRGVTVTARRSVPRP